MAVVACYNGYYTEIKHVYAHDCVRSYDCLKQELYTILKSANIIKNISKNSILIELICSAFFKNRNKERTNCCLFVNNISIYVHDKSKCELLHLTNEDYDLIHNNNMMIYDVEHLDQHIHYEIIIERNDFKKRHHAGIFAFTGTYKIYITISPIIPYYVFSRIYRPEINGHIRSTICNIASEKFVKGLDRIAGKIKKYICES